MEKEPEELKLLGFFGIFGQAYKIIYSWRDIITKITISLILPLSLIFLANRIASATVFADMDHHQRRFEYRIGWGNKKIANILRSQDALNQIASYTSLKYGKYIAFNIAYYIIYLAISLLSTSAVVYTVACAYIDNTQITFRKIMSVVPKVWKRLLITFLWNVIIETTYIIVMVLIFVLGFFGLLYSFGPNHPLVIIIFVLVWVIMVVMGLIYINVIWTLACVVTVLEEDMCGIKAMRKSKVLIKGKLWVSIMIYIILQILLIEIDLTASGMIDQYYISKPYYSPILEDIGVTVMYGILCILLLLHVNLIGLVIQSVIYFVCKSYHDENIDKTSLRKLLNVYLGEYVPLKEVQLQQNDGFA